MYVLLLIIALETLGFSNGAVDANASIGARNVIVTNSDLDTSVLSASLLIR